MRDSKVNKGGKNSVKKNLFPDDEIGGYTSGEYSSSDEVIHTTPCKKNKINSSLIPIFEKELSNAVSYNDLVRFENFLLQYSEDLRILEDEFFHVINTALITPRVTPWVIDLLFKNGFEVSNDDDYIANSLHIANHRKLSKDIKDLLIQNGATIASLGEGSKYSEGMTSCRAQLLRENTKQNSAAITTSAADLAIISHEAESDQSFVQDNPNVLAVFKKADLLNYIASYAGVKTVLGDELEENERLRSANKGSIDVQTKIYQLSQQHSSKLPTLTDDKGGHSSVTQFQTPGR
jgi:hypothetical protein